MVEEEATTAAAAAQPGEGKQEDHRVRNITRGVSSLSVQNIGTSILAFILLFVLARIFGTNGYGVYSAILLVVGIAAAFSSFGLQLASTRYVALLKPKNEAESWSAARSTLILSLVFSIAVTVAYSLLTPYFSIFFTKSTQWTDLFLLGGLWLFGSSIAATLQGIIQGLKRYALIAKMLLVSRVIMVVFTILVLLKYDNLFVPVAGWIIYYLLIVGWSFKIVGKGILSPSNDGGGERKAEKKKKRYPYSTIMKYSFPLGIAGIIQVFASNSDALVVGGYLASASLGIYNAVLQLTAVLGLVLVTPLVTAFFPEASSIEGSSEISNAFRVAMRFVMLSVLPASFILAGLSTQFITLLQSGGTYIAGVQPMELISFFYVFVALQGIAIYLLQAVGRTTKAMISGIVSAAVVAISSILLVPELGLLGAATSRILASIIGLAVALYYSRKYIANVDKFSFYAKCFVSSVIPFGACYILSLIFSSRTLTIIPYSIISGLLLVLCFKALKVLSEDDKRYIGHLLPSFAQRFLRYI